MQQLWAVFGPKPFKPQTSRATLGMPMSDCLDGQRDLTGNLHAIPAIHNRNFHLALNVNSVNWVISKTFYCYSKGTMKHVSKSDDCKWHYGQRNTV